MVLVRRVSQKFSHLKSRNAIVDFFVSFDESRSLEIKREGHDLNLNGLETPIRYREKSIGNCTVIWPENKFSKGMITVTDTEEFENYIKNAKKNRNNYSQIYTPAKTMFPIVRANSKVVSDNVDNPEYVLKITKLFKELDQSLKLPKISDRIKLIDSVKSAYFSNGLDLSYLFTKVQIEKNFWPYFVWKYESVEIPSLIKIQEVLSFFADIYNILKKEDNATSRDFNSNPIDVVIPPHLFKKIFNELVLVNLDGENVLNGTSIFSREDFYQKAKKFGIISISYDPLMSLKLGTYSFTDFGLAPDKQYFVKFGRLQQPILNDVNFAQLGYTSPTVQVKDIENVKIDGIPKTLFNSIRNLQHGDILFVPDFDHVHYLSKEKILIFSRNAAYLSQNIKKTSSVKNVLFEINLTEKLSKREIELVEFIDGKVGLKINKVHVNRI